MGESIIDRFSLDRLGKRIKACRKAKKKTQDELAAAIGVSKTTVSEWERGIKQPGILNLLNSCYFLGITLDELLELKAQRYFNITFTEEEREAMLLMLDECKREAESNNNLHSKLHFLEQHIKAFFSRAQSK